MSPLVAHLSERVLYLKSENASLEKRLASERGRREEIAKQLVKSIEMCDSLKDQVVKVRSLNTKLVAGYRSLMAKVKARQGRLRAAEKQYQEARFQHGWNAEDTDSCRQRADLLKMLEEKLIAEQEEEVDWHPSTQVNKQVCFRELFIKKVHNFRHCLKFGDPPPPSTSDIIRNILNFRKYVNVQIDPKKQFKYVPFSLPGSVGFF